MEALLSGHSMEGMAERVGPGRLPAPLRTGPAGRRSISPTGVIAAVLVALAVVAFLAFVAGADSGLLIVALAMATTAVPFALAALEVPRRLIHPLTLVGFTMFFGVAGQTAYFVLFASPADQAPLLAGVRQDGLAKGVLVVAVGTIALALGYIVARARQPRMGRLMARAVAAGMPKPSVQRMTVVVGLLCVISVVSFLLWASKVGIASPTDLLWARKRFVETEAGYSPLGYHLYGISLAAIAFLLAVYTVLVRGVSRSSLPVVALGCFGLAVTAAYAFASSTRVSLFSPLAMAALVGISVKGREPRSAVMAGALVIGLAVLALLLGFRTVAQSPEVPGESRISQAINNAGLVDQTVASGDWAAIGVTSAVVSRVPERYPYQYGRSLVSSLWAPVPRSVWSGKPPVRIDHISPPVFNLPYGWTHWYPPGLVGELWLNGALPAVVIGMIVFGAALARIEYLNQMTVQTGGLAGLLYGVLAVPVALWLPGLDVTGVVLTVLQILPVIAVALWFTRERTPANVNGGEAV
jgi:hypothetical protein